MSGTLQQKGMLINAVVHMWSGKAKVREVGEAAETAFKMKQGRADPAIWLVEPSWFKRPMSTANMLRAVIRRYCLRFGQGWLLPTALHQKFHQEWRIVLAAHRAEVKRFLSEYPRLKQEGMAALGTIPNVTSLYPEQDEVKKKFEVELEVSPIGDPNTWQLQLDETTVEQLKIDFDNLLGRQIEAAVNDALWRLQTYIKHMAETLADPDKNKFHTTLVNNVYELMELMPAFNLTENPQVDELIADIKQSLFKGSAKDLKEDPHLRKNVAGEAERIAKNMAALLGPPPDANGDVTL